MGWQERKKEISKDMEKVRADRMSGLNRDLGGKQEVLGKEVMAYLVGKVLNKYP